MLQWFKHCKKSIPLRRIDFTVQYLWCTPLPWIVQTSTTTMFLWQTSCSRVITEREKWSAGPVLRFTSPHILNSLIFPLDTAKNHRLNSIEHQYYRQRHFMQLTAAYLSHSLLTSLLICGGGGEGGGWMTERNEEGGRQTLREKERAHQVQERRDGEKWKR